MRQAIRSLVALPALPAIVAALVVVGVACAVTWPSLAGEMPISQDHTVHLFRVWHFFEKRLLHGQLTAWSSDWFAGWPAGEDYPPGGDLWMAAFRALTPFCSWDATYAVGFAAMYAGVGLALFAFARSWNLAAAVTAGVLLVLDRGDYREGGFLYTVYWGVWPQHLSLGLVIAGLAALFRHLETDDVRWLAVGGAAFGAALVCHPIALIVLVAALPAFVAAHWRRAVRAASRVAIAIALGWAIAAFFSLPFSARAAWMATYGDPWKSLASIGDGLLHGNVFRNVPPPVVWAAILGGGLGLWLRDVRAIFLAAWIALLLLIASSTFTDAAWLVRLSPAFGQVQWQRLAAFCKAAAFLLAAFAICRGLPVLAAPRLRAWKRGARLAGGIALLLALAVATPFAYGMWRKHYAPDRVRSMRDQRALQAHYDDFLEWSANTRRNATDFYRIAYVASYNDHTFAAAPVWNHTPAYKVGYTPASNFLHKPDQGTPELYRTLSVKYVVAKKRLTEPQLALERSFGPIHVYRFSGYTPQRWTLAGSGNAMADIFDEEHVRFTLRDVGPESRIVLHVAEHPRWTARLNGQIVPIEVSTLAEEPIFVGVSNLRGATGDRTNGDTLDIRWERKPVDTVAAAISVLGVLLVVALAGWGRVRARQQIATPLVRADRFIAVALGCAVTLGVVLVGVRAARASQPSKWSLRGNLSAAVVSLERLGETAAPPQACPWDGRRHRCDGPSWNYVGLIKQRMAGAIHSCVWAHPIGKGRLRIHLPGVPLAQTLIVRHGLADSAIDGNRTGAPVHLTVALDGKVVREEVRPNRKGFPAFQIPTAGLGKADLDLVITTSKDAARHYCVDVETSETPMKQP